MRVRLKESFWVGVLALFGLAMLLVMVRWTGNSNISSLAKSKNSGSSGVGGGVLSKVYSYRRPAGARSNHIAICVTGQLARLELVSKIRNIIVPTLLAGDRVQLFLYLDSAVEDVGQTMWQYNYSTNPYIKYAGRSDRLKLLVEREIARQYDHLKQYSPAFRNLTLHPQDAQVHVRVESIARVVFHVVDNRVPVDNKTYKYEGAYNCFS
jgi:hypothetical protein